MVTVYVLVYTDVAAAVIKYLLLAITYLLPRLCDQRLSFSQAYYFLMSLIECVETFF